MRTRKRCEGFSFEMPVRDSKVRVASRCLDTQPEVSRDREGPFPTPSQQPRREELSCARARVHTTPPTHTHPTSPQ